MAGELLKRCGIGNKYLNDNIVEVAMIDPIGEYIESIMITDENLLAFEYIFHGGYFFKKHTKQNNMEIEFRRVRFMVTQMIDLDSDAPLCTDKEPDYSGGPEEEETHG